MAAITIENQLYLYSLFSQKVGIGRQVMLARIEEVLAEDDIWPSDLGCASARELLEELSDFVRLTVFKKGRVYATVMSNPEWDEALERASAQKAGPAEKGGPKSWKRKRSKRSLRPVRPRPKGRPKEEAEPEVGAEAVAGPEVGAEAVVGPEATEPEGLPVAESKPDATVQAEPAVATQTAAQAEPAVVTQAEPDARATVAETEKAESDATPVAEPVIMDQVGSEAAPITEPAPVVEDAVAEPESNISFNIIYDPHAEEEADEDPAPKTATAATSHAKQEVPKKTSNLTPASQTRYPQHFAAEVLVRNEELSALYQMLPLDVDPMVILDEDWRIARSTQSIHTNNGTVTFPLRYLKGSDAEPVRVCLRRSGTGLLGRRWSVTSISHAEDVGFEGLLVTSTEVMRELAQFAIIGPWEELAKQLNSQLANTQVSFSQDELRDYLCITFHRIMCEKKLVVYDKDTKAAFDTGLLDSEANSILMCFESREGDIAWQFVGFFQPKELQLDGTTPLPATYLFSLRDIALTAETGVQVDKALIRSHGRSIEHAVDVALRHARRDYRLATPAYDPITNEVRLLLPVEDKDTTQALVLRPQEDGFVASSLVSLEHASTCARIVSRELPRWLAQC